MAWPKHFLYSFRGHLGPTAQQEIDVWSCNIRVSRVQSVTNDIAATQSLATDAARDWKKFHTAGSSNSIGHNVWFDYVRLYTIGSNGKADGEIFQGEPEGGSVTNSVSSPNMPFQVAMVVTLDTGLRVKPRFGRFFVPSSGIQIGGSGRVVTSYRDGLLDAAQTLIQDLGNRPGIDSTAHKVSVVSSVGDGAIADVKSIRVGDVADTMRSRRSALKESYEIRTISQ
uniref:Uncharacterized protein n=1 Tax=uncultured prokaryote TaxID=198431 RepID=A0A0H5Q375_9ZZZZ|nr:hypothetical protein [uncultured prokaryote]